MASIEASTDRFSQLYSLEVVIMAIGFCLIVGQCGLLKGAGLVNIRYRHTLAL